MIKGSTVGNISSVFIVILLVSQLQSVFNSVPSSYNPGSVSETEQIKIERGRVGLSIFISGSMIFFWWVVADN